MKYVMVSKAQKVNGKRQTWQVFTLRPNVSATVWEPTGRDYFQAGYAKTVAEQTFGPISWRRATGRGSANFYGIVK